jgi:hypothetical protein
VAVHHCEGVNDLLSLERPSSGSWEIDRGCGQRERRWDAVRRPLGALRWKHVAEVKSRLHGFAPTQPNSGEGSPDNLIFLSLFFSEPCRARPDDGLLQLSCRCHPFQGGRAAGRQARPFQDKGHLTCRE